jgi:hypothetical protein
MNEKQLERKLFNACKKVKIWCIKGDSKNNVGFPDRVIFDTRNNQIYYVELKNDTYYDLTYMQKLWANIIKASGGQWFLINGEKELEDFIEKYIYKGEVK